MTVETTLEKNSSKELIKETYFSYLMMNCPKPVLLISETELRLSTQVPCKRIQNEKFCHFWLNNHDDPTIWQTLFQKTIFSIKHIIMQMMAGIVCLLPDSRLSMSWSGTLRMFFQVSLKVGFVQPQPDFNSALNHGSDLLKLKSKNLGV